MQISTYKNEAGEIDRVTAIAEGPEDVQALVAFGKPYEDARQARENEAAQAKAQADLAAEQQAEKSKAQQNVDDATADLAKAQAKLDAAHAAAQASGSGTGRYGNHGNWTFGSDGTGYHPDSYGTGKPLEPFVPFVAPDPRVVGSSFRILKGDGSVDPVVHVATAVTADLITYESEGETLEVRREHTVRVIPPAV